MKKQLLLFLVTVIAGTFAMAQYNLNDYKYVIVEKQFHFQNEPDLYNLNQLVGYEFRKLGFKVLYENEGLPEDLKKDICLALNSEVLAKGALRTKATVILRNCSGDIVYTSEEGITKEKDFARAYQLSIQKAFDSMEDIQHNYVPKKKDVYQSEKEETVKEEVKVEKDVSEEADKAAEVVEAASQKIESPVKEETVEATGSSNWIDDVPSFQSDAGVLYLIDNAQGLTLVNTNKEVIYTLKKTGNTNVYIVTNKGAYGVATFDESTSDIRLEFYEGETLKTSVLKANQ